MEKHVRNWDVQGAVIEGVVKGKRQNDAFGSLSRDFLCGWHPLRLLCGRPITQSSRTAHSPRRLAHCKDFFLETQITRVVFQFHNVSFLPAPKKDVRMLSNED